MSRYIVKAGNAAQVAVGEAAVFFPAHQRDFQLIFGAALGDFIHALQGLERSRQRFFFGALGGLRLAACALRVGGVGQHADHGVQVGVPGGGVHLGGGGAVFILFIGHGQPVVDFLHEGLRILAAAGGDGAAVGACHAAHKAAVRGDRAAGVVGGDQAVFDLAAVAAHDAADVRGVCHFGGGVLAGAHVGRALHMQRNVVDRAALHGAAVAARDAADRAADGVDAAATANGALIGTPNQSTAVAADNAAQVAIFVHALGQVGFDRNRIFIVRAADRADVLAHGTARRYGVGGGGQTTKVKDIVFYLCRFNRTCVISNNAAHFGSRAVQAHCAVSVEQVRIFDERTRLVAGRNAADSIRCAANIRVIHKGRRDRAIVMGCYAARFTVGRSDTAHHCVILQCAACFIAAGNTARITAARVQRLAAGCVMAASIDAAIVAARNAARILVCYLDRPGFVGNKLDKPFIAARHAAAVGSRRYPCAGFNRHGVRAGCVRVNTDRTACPIKARHTANLAGAADLHGHAFSSNTAHIIPRHAADGGDAIDLAGGFGQADGAGIIPRRTADVHAAADGNARRRGRIGDAAVVDARDAAEIAVVLLLAAHGILHAAAGDRAVVDARQAARRHGVLHAAIVGAVLQRRVFRRIADDAAREVAAAGSIQRSQRNTVIENVRAAVGRVRRVAAGQAAVRLGAALAAVAGVGQGKAGSRRVVADDAAHVGVCLDVKPVAQPRQRNRGAR